MNELRTTLDTGKETYMALKCKQNDDRTLILTLLSNGVVWIPEVGSILELRGKRSDSTVTIQTTTGITITNNVVTIDLNKEFTKIQGAVELELNIRKLTEITTFTFILVIEPSVIQDGAIVSKNTSNLLDELKDMVDWINEHSNVEDWSNHFVYTIRTDDVTFGVPVVSITRKSSLKNVLNDWGDGTMDDKDFHEYAVAGTYKIKVYYGKILYGDILKVHQIPYGGNGVNNDRLSPSHEGEVGSIKELFKNQAYLTECCDIPKGIGNLTGAFWGNRTLVKMPNISFEEGTELNCSEMFYGCRSLVEATPIPDNVVNCYGMFDTCEALVIPPALGDNVKNCSRMFYICSSLIHTPIFTENIEDVSYMFYGCTSLVKVYPMGGLLKIKSGNNMFYDCSSLITVHNLPSGLTNGSNMFMNCRSLITVPNLPSGLIDGKYMFMNCSSLRTVPNLPDGLIDGSYMFRNCSSLRTVPNLPDGITSGNRMFMDCSSLETVSNLPNGLIDGTYMFYGCYSLETVPNLPDGLTSGNGMFINCSSLRTVPNLPDGLTKGQYMFRNCSSLRTVPNLPDGLIDGTYMFYDCSSLVTVPNLPDGLIEGTYMFHRCSSLITVPNLPDGIINGTYMFYGCHSLRTVPNLPDGLINGRYMFMNCSSLRTVPNLPDGLINGNRMFSLCNLTEVPNLPNTIEDYTYMFYSNKITAIPDDIMSFINVNPDLDGKESSCFGNNPIVYPQPYSVLKDSSQNPSYRWFRP